MGLLSNLFRVRPEEKKKHFPPIPQWRPDTPINHHDILDRARYYTDNRLQLGVFRYGTVAFFATHVSDIEKEAKECLDKIYHYHADFKPINMDDGNYIIEYSQPAFTIVFQHELDAHWDYIEKKHRQGVCSDEVLINGKGQHNVFDRIGKICLFGRAKMFMDAQGPEIVKVFDPVMS